MFECFSAESVRESGYFVKFMRSCDGFGAILNRAWERNSSRSRKKRNNLSPRWAGPRQGYCSVKNMMTMRMVTMMRMTMTMMSGGFVVKSGRRVSSPGKPATLFDPALLLIIIDHRRNDDDQSHWLNSTKQDHQRWRYIIETLSIYGNMEWFEQRKWREQHIIIDLINLMGRIVKHMLFLWRLPYASLSPVFDVQIDPIVLPSLWLLVWLKNNQNGWIFKRERLLWEVGRGEYAVSLPRYLSTKRTRSDSSFF